MNRIVLAFGAGLACASSPASAQVAAPLQPGEIIESGGGQQIKVVQCFATQYRWRECDTVGWQNGRAVSNVARLNEEDLLKWDARVRAARGMAPRGTVGSATVQRSPPRAAAPAATGRPVTGGGARIPDGTYSCQMWMGGSYVSLGTVRSVNGSLDSGLLRKVGATLTSVTPNAQGITINYKTARGYNESMDCKR